MSDLGALTLSITRGHHSLNLRSIDPGSCQTYLHHLRRKVMEHPTWYLPLGIVLRVLTIDVSEIISCSSTTDPEYHVMPLNSLYSTTRWQPEITVSLTNK